MEWYAQYLNERGVKKYRTAQVHQAMYRDLCNSFEEIQTLPKELREDMQKQLVFSPLKLLQEKTSKDGTIKALFEIEGGLKVEAVLMRHHNDRNTVCVSSQVGCAVGCTFCCTGKMGLKKNLNPDEIVAQVLYFVKKLNQSSNKVTNIVFMGMGEPFHNYDNVMKSIYIMNDPKKLAFGSRHITISTSGVVSQIKKFTQEELQVNLAISLHAPNEKIRSSIMPINDIYSLKELMQSLDEYTNKTGRRIFYEYIMLKDTNDSDNDAKELGKLLQGKLAHINLIPFNPGAGESLEGSLEKRIKIFQKILHLYGVPSTIRITLGQDIQGACGQLAINEQ